MKTIVVYQTHPFGGGIIIIDALVLRNLEEWTNEVEVAGNDMIWVDKPEGAIFTRRISFANISLYGRNNTTIRGSVYHNGQMHFVAVDVFYCDDNITLEEFVK